MSSGPLRRAACIETGLIDGAIGWVGLGRFLPRLDTDHPWATLLPEVEKQRLARILIRRFHILVLDEVDVRASRAWSSGIDASSSPTGRPVSH